MRILIYFNKAFDYIADLFANHITDITKTNSMWHFQCGAEYFGFYLSSNNLYNI